MHAGARSRWHSAQSIGPVGRLTRSTSQWRHLGGYRTSTAVFPIAEAIERNPPNALFNHRFAFSRPVVMGIRRRGCRCGRSGLAANASIIAGWLKKRQHVARWIVAASRSASRRVCVLTRAGKIAYAAHPIVLVPGVGTRRSMRRCSTMRARRAPSRLGLR